MTTRVLCLNNAGAEDRLTLHGIYRVVGVRGVYVVVIDNRGERTLFWRERFTPLEAKAKEEMKVRG